MTVNMIIFCVAMLVIGWITEKKIINPLTVFYGVWSIIFYLYNLQLYNLIAAKNETLQMMFIGLIVFAIGYYIWRIYCKQSNIIIKCNNFKFSIQTKNKFELRYKILYCIYIACIVYYLIEVTTILKYLITSNSLAFIREYAQSKALEKTGILTALGTILFNPLVMAVQPIIACEFWHGKRNLKLFILNIIVLFLRTLVDGSRANLIYFSVHFCVAFILYYGKQTKKQKIITFTKKNKKKNQKIMIGLGAVIIFFIALTTISRSGGNTIRHAYYYFTMEPYMFEIWAEKAQNLVGYGLASTNGFSFIVLYVLKNLKIFSGYPEFWHSINILIGETESQWQIISSTNTMANAYVSIFWFFYLDGRIIGIIIGMFIYGAICANSFWKAIQNLSPKTVALFSFILQGLLMSFVRFQFANITYACAFVIIHLMYKKKKN